MLREFLQDLRYGLRAMRQHRAFAATAILILSLGIGANATVFSLLRTLFHQPPPLVQAPDELVGVVRIRPDSQSRWHCYPTYRYYRDHDRTLDGLAAYDASGIALTVGVGNDNLQAEGWLVSDNYFEVLGIQPVVGRGFAADEGRIPGQSPVAWISHGFWQRRFGGEPGVVGREVRLNGHRFAIIGVAPAGFRGISPLDSTPDLWLPLTMQPLLWQDASALRHVPGDHTWWLQLIGRLPATTGLEQAAAEIRSLTRQIVEDQPQLHRDQQAALTRQIRYSSGARAGLLELFELLGGAVVLVLMVAGANIAILLLARASTRGREMGLRVALGAKPGRLRRQLLTESLLLALAGGLGGFLLASWSTDLAARLMPYAPAGDFTPDADVLGFSLALAAATAALFSLAPAVRVGRRDVAATLDLGRSGAPGRSFLRGALVVSQVAASIVLLSGAALLARSAWRAQAVDPGFAAADRLLVQVDLSRHGYGKAAGQRLIAAAIEGLAALPGVGAASSTSTVPFELFWDDVVQAEGVEPPPGQEGFTAQIITVGPGYFSTLAIPLLAGRELDRRDAGRSPPVAVVNRAAAQAVWGSPVPTALGETLLYGSPPERYTVVGVVGDTAVSQLGGPPSPQVYFSVLQEYSPEVTFVLHGRSDATAPAASAAAATPLSAAARRELLRLAPGLAFSKVEPLAEVLARQIGPYRNAGLLVGLFAALALALASSGLFGVLSYLVNQRRREIGVRVALGASRRRIARAVVWRGLRLTALGIAVGAVAAAATSRLWASLLYGVEPMDPVAAIAAALLLLAVAWAASLIPAHRASRVQPTAVLRQE